MRNTSTSGASDPDLAGVEPALRRAAKTARELSSSMVNLHAVFVVLGGCIVAILINTPLRYLIKAFTELKPLLFYDNTAGMQKVIPVITGLAEQCRMRMAKHQMTRGT